MVVTVKRGQGQEERGQGSVRVREERGQGSGKKRGQEIPIQSRGFNTVLSGYICDRLEA